MDAETLEMRVDRLTGHYRHLAETVMAGIPLLNPRLSVAATPFLPHGGQAFGVVVTPWFMNLVAIDLPGEARLSGARPGETVACGLPAGRVDFIAGSLDGFGRVDACSLFSPMDEFADMQAAIDVANGVMTELFIRPEEAKKPFEPAAAERPRELSRRFFLTGRQGGEARP